MIFNKPIGGLGNQLFCIFATICYAIKQNQKFTFLNKKEIYYGTDRDNMYFNNFLLELEPFTTGNINEPNMEIIHDTHNFEYFDFPSFPKEKNVLLNGYFQTDKYFKEYYKPICKMINLNSKRLHTKYKYKYEYQNLISMHFRLGDYKNLPQYHCILSSTYYKNALKYVIDNSTGGDILDVLYFCEKEDEETVSNIVSEIQAQFPKIIFIKIDYSIKDWEQLLIMSLCKHNIIANSTFSWWAAYFNDNENKIVCYPDKWYGPMLSYINQNDFYPNSWIKISNS